MAIAPPDAKLTGSVLLYKNPEPLSAAMHGHLSLNPSDTPYAVAKTAHAVPVIIGEFGPASLSYPIVFSGADFLPLAIMSVRPNENLFISDDGVFEDGNYIPAFLRRYPFVTAQTGGDGQFIVCIDRGADILVEGGQTPLFEGDQPSQFTKDCLKFCSDFEADRRKTQDFVKMLRDLDLFELREVTLKPQNPDGSLGELVKVTDYFTPAEERVKALPESTQMDMLKSGAMQQIHHHWNSLWLWERLLNTTFKRFPAPQIQAIN